MPWMENAIICRQMIVVAAGLPHLMLAIIIAIVKSISLSKLTKILNVAALAYVSMIAVRIAGLAVSITSLMINK
jgi:hypothetical protein